jgi:small-conductance mechanosensitive channel
MDEGLPHTIAMMARYVLITIGVLLAFSALGLPMSDLAIMFSAFGVGIGFGLQSIFNNLVSGFILLFERPIKIGDTIEVGELVGTVRSIGIRASNIRTFDGAEIIVPNGNLISNEVINWTLSDQRRRIEIKINVSYKTDPNRVTKILLKLLEEHEEVANDPKPGIYFIEMGESALVFRVLFWTYHYGKWYSIRSRMMYEIFDTLKAAGIEIPYNQLDLHLRSSDEGGIHPKSAKNTKESQ